MPWSLRIFGVLQRSEKGVRDKILSQFKIDVASRTVPIRLTLAAHHLINAVRSDDATTMPAFAGNTFKAVVVGQTLITVPPSEAWCTFVTKEAHESSRTHLPNISTRNLS